MFLGVEVEDGAGAVDGEGACAEGDDASRGEGVVERVVDVSCEEGGEGVAPGVCEEAFMLEKAGAPGEGAVVVVDEREMGTNAITSEMPATP